MSSDLIHPEITPQALLEFRQAGDSDGAICALLAPALKAKLAEIGSGQVLEVRVDDPAAKEDILSWSRLSGNPVLAMFEDGPQHLRFYLQKK